MTQTPKTILITGAAGFIGFHLSRKLLNQGCTVIGLDNLNDYYDPNLKHARLDQLTPHPSFTHVNIDLADRSAMEDLFSKHHKYIGKKAKKNFLPMQKGDVPATCANVDDLEKDVGFKPNTPIHTGIRNFVEWYLEFYMVRPQYGHA